MADKTTPPGSSVSSPLTPPPTDGKTTSNIRSILNAFQSHYRGSRPTPWLVYSLRREKYEDVLQILRSDPNLDSHIKCKVRYDYDPRCSLLIIRMPTPLHEIVCAEVVREINRQLEAISDCPEAVYAQKIKPFASSRVELPEVINGEERYIIREPDASFGHTKARFPGVVVEICYSQKRRAIRDLVDDYILCTDGSINAVVCLDIEYRRTKKATISVWRPAYRVENGVEVFEATPEVDEEVFRTDNGQALDAMPLRLNLKDFAPADLTNDYPDLNRHEIMISSRQLCGFLSQAESRQDTQERHIGSINHIRPGARKRRRTVTPDSDSQSEQEGPKRHRHDDSEYHPSSSPTRLSD